MFANSTRRIGAHEVGCVYGWLIRGKPVLVADGLQTGFTTFVNYLPQLIGALLILLIGFIIAKILDKIISRVCARPASMAA